MSFLKLFSPKYAYALPLALLGGCVLLPQNPPPAAPLPGVPVQPAPQVGKPAPKLIQTIVPNVSLSEIGAFNNASAHLACMDGALKLLPDHSTNVLVKNFATELGQNIATERGNLDKFAQDHHLSLINRCQTPRDVSAYKTLSNLYGVKYDAALLNYLGNAPAGDGIESYQALLKQSSAQAKAMRVSLFAR